MFSRTMTGLRVGLLHLRDGETLQKVTSAVAVTESRLYVAIPLAEAEGMESTQRRLSAVYHAAQRTAPEVDTLVLLTHYCPPDVGSLLGYADSADDRALAKAYDLPMVELPAGNESDPLAGATLPAPEHAPWTKYDHVCMGGTFDKLHIGQKLLLSLALLTCAPGGRFFCGIAGDNLFAQKALRELIDPYGIRERTVLHFLATIAGGKAGGKGIQTAELVDKYGPSVTDPAFQAIVVSEETRAGGDACNEERRRRGLKDMAVVVVGLLDASGALSAEPIDAAAKLSSTAKRQRIVGQLLDGDELWCRRAAASRPYSIGLTGGIACGKSTICEWLGKQPSVEIVNADKLGHAAYEVGTPGCAAVAAAFPGVATDDGSIDRQVLGGIVFGDKAEMKRLTDIVWPIIREMVVERVAASTARVVVVEAAILVEAGWGDLFDEVWVAVVPPNIAKTRLMQRNGLAEAEAEKRIASQMDGVTRAGAAHVLLSNHGDPAALEAQLAEAWGPLQARMGRTLSDLGGLARRWAELTAALPSCDAAFWWREIRDRYAVRARAYHNLRHLEEMFSLYDACKGEFARPDLVAYAIFFHDVVYDATVGGGRNERDSAAMWERFAAAAGGGISDADRALVAGWIIRTATHMAGPAEGDLAYFLDIDLGVLGRPPASYAEYAEAISREYSHIPYPTFCTARAAAMSAFTANPAGPYFTAAMQARCGKQAVANITTETQRLTEEATFLSRLA